MRILSVATLAVLLTVFGAACGTPSESQDAGEGQVDAGCDPTAAGNYDTGKTLDAGYSVEWQQQCGKAPEFLRKDGAVNAFCATARACSHSVCSCPNGDKSYSASACEVVCRDANFACPLALNTEPRLCQ